MTTDADQSLTLCDAVRRAFETGGRLRIMGSGSKSFLTRGVPGEGDDPSGSPSALLCVAEHHGIVDYRPEELVLTARAGTPLREVERELARAGQHLPFEPPRYRAGGTLGGAVACGLAGPGRPWRGGVRDAVLGVELINGRGEALRFGGQVMKNVAGYDIARLQAGAFGTLGVLLSVSLKVLPAPAVEITRVFELDAAEALSRCRQWARRPVPMTGACWWKGQLRIRLSGAESAVRHAADALGGEQDAEAGFWEQLRDQRLEHFEGPGLWRCSVPPAAPRPLAGCLVNWAGAERWWRPGPDDAPAEAVAAEGGHGRPFDRSFGARTVAYASRAELEYSARLRAAFDPERVLNPELSTSGEPHLAD